MSGPVGGPDPLAQVATWPVRAAAAVLERTGARTTGPVGAVLPWASVTKVLTAWAVLVAVEDGSVALDDPVGPPGSTLRHLLAHASGLDADSDAVRAAPGTRRIYSNRGIAVAAAHVEAATGIPWDRYLAEAVLEPLGMARTTLAGSPAHGAEGPLVDLVALAGELRSPTLLAPATVAAATSVQFPGLAGVLPGFGRQDPNDWGLGVEVRGAKSPHWTATAGSPRTFGHFGRSGSWVWVDPDVGVACCGLSEAPFGPWAAAAWPALADAVLAEPR